MVCFFDLPRPVRETVYRHALVTTRVFIRPLISMEYLLNPYRAETYGIPNLALLCVSRKIYQEATPIYLGENIFTIVQVDMLAAARMENRRVAKNLQKIGKLELIFDNRDYQYMARFLGAELPVAMAEIDDWADESPFKRAAIRDMSRMHTHFDMSVSTSALVSPSCSFTTTESERECRSNSSIELQQHEGDMSERTPHERQIQNLKEYLWGRALTFVRQTFRLTHLYIDLRHCFCPRGCCRLADEVLDWGWVYVWIHGLPDEVQVRGSSGSEKEVIARSLDRQSFRPRLKPEQIYDQRRAIDYRRVLQYNALLKSVHRRLAQM